MNAATETQRFIPGRTNLRAYLAGRPLRNVLDPDLLY